MRSMRAIFAALAITLALAAPSFVLGSGFPASSGGIVDSQINGFRLTLTTGTPVTTSDVTGATSIYLTPYRSSMIALYSGSSWSVVSGSEVTIALGTLSNATNYDLFAYSNAGVLAVDTPLAWSTDTARATALVLQDGVKVKSGDTTRRWIGTFRTTSTTTTADSRNQRFLFNASNRVLRSNLVQKTASWSQAFGSWGAMDGGSSSFKHEFVFGWQEESVSARMFNTYTQAAGGAGVLTGIGLDSTTTVSSQSTCDYDFQGGGSQTLAGTMFWAGWPGLGYHYLCGLASPNGTGNATFNANAGSGTRAGLVSEVWN